MSYNDFTFGGGSVADILPDSSQDVSDLVTLTTPITIAAGSVATMLINDGLTANVINVYGDIVQLYNTATQSLDFTGTKVNDRIDFRLDLTLVTATNNTDLEVGLSAGIGGVYPFTLPLYTRQIKKFGINRLLVYGWMTIDSTATRDNPAKFYIKTDGVGTDTAQVNGWKIYHSPRIRL
jgi:hypothetical protein